MPAHRDNEIFRFFARAACRAPQRVRNVGNQAAEISSPPALDCGKFRRKVAPRRELEEAGSDDRVHAVRGFAGEPQPAIEVPVIAGHLLAVVRHPGFERRSNEPFSAAEVPEQRATADSRGVRDLIHRRIETLGEDKSAGCGKHMIDDSLPLGVYERTGRR